MKPPAQTTAIATDGLRYSKKAAGSPYGSSPGLTISCIRCGLHKARSLLKPIRVAGKVHYCCEEDCRPGAAEKKAAVAATAAASASGVQQWRAQPWATKVPYELAVSLDNFEHDDRRQPTLAQAVEEARYIIGLHSEGGTESHAMFTGERGEEEQAEAKKTVKDCRNFIKRHEDVATTT
jgi:hypothetical protein